MHWNLEVDAEQRRVYTRETKRGHFRLVLVRGRSGFVWRVDKRVGERREKLAFQLVRFPNEGWDPVEGLSFVAAESVVVPPLEQLANVGVA